jgi:hypothetical protein
VLKTIFVPPQKGLQIIIDFGFIQFHAGYLPESTRKAERKITNLAS